MSGIRGIGNKPQVVGLTGNYGTGKSTVAGFFKKEGAFVVSADRLVHEVYKKGHRLYPRLQSLFPELKGRTNRNRIAKIVFQDASRRRRLETLLHPYVFDRFKQEIRKTKGLLVILEVPLLFESGFDKECDETVVVWAPRDETRRRLLKQGIPSRQIESRWRVQMPLREKVRRAHFVIDNSNGLGRTRREVRKVWKTLQERERSLPKYGDKRIQREQRKK